MEDYIEEEVKRIVKIKEEGWKREGKVIFWKKQVYVLDSTTFQE